MGKHDNKKKKQRINQYIKARRVMVISETGDKLGEFLTQDAIALASDRGLDLVEVSSSDEKTICKIMDWGKHQYQKSKQNRKQKQSQTKTKELGIKPKTDKHDIEVVERKARKFLEQGHRVKIAVEFRGREHVHHDIGADKCKAIAENLSDIADIEEQPKMSGRKMFMILAKKKDEKKK